MLHFGDQFGKSRQMSSRNQVQFHLQERSDEDNFQTDIVDHINEEDVDIEIVEEDDDVEIIGDDDVEIIEDDDVEIIEEDDDVVIEDENVDEEVVTPENDKGTIQSFLNKCDNFNEEGYIMVKLSDIRKEVECPICLGIIRNTRVFKKCIHRFCQECIDKSMRLGNNECPKCREHCASRRSLRNDPGYETVISAIFPDIDQYEEKELAFQEDDKARNKQTQATIAQANRRQKTRDKKQRRSKKKNHGRRNYQSSSDDEDDVYGHGDGGKKCKAETSLAPASVDEANDTNMLENSLTRVSTEFFGTTSNSPLLVWGKGGIRSSIARHGSCSNGNNNHPQSRLSRLAEHLQKSNITDAEMDIHVILVSLDKMKEPFLDYPYLNARPTLSIGELCQFISSRTFVPPDKVEIWGVRSICSKLSSLSTVELQSLKSIAVDASKDELQILDAKETLDGLKATSDFARGQLVLSYRLKLE